MQPDWLARAVEEGRSILAAAVDAQGLPACCRGVAMVPGDDPGTVTVYLPVATSQEVLADVATTRRLAVVSSAPLTHETLQIKGIVRNVRLAGRGEAELVRTRMEAFAAVLGEIGLPRRAARQIAHWPAFALELAVSEVYEQTPGPNAGAPVE